MSQRFQLALNVDNIETAIEYYGKLFGVEPMFEEVGETRLVGGVFGGHGR